MISPGFVGIQGPNFGTGYTGPFDIAPTNILGGYSIARILKSDYTGDLIKVRRSSDNAEQLIGAVDNEFDTTSYSSFVGGGNGFASEWIDQNGGTTGVQSTMSKQSQVNLSGMNGKVNMGSVATQAYILTGMTSSSNDYTMYFVIDPSSLSGSPWIFDTITGRIITILNNSGNYAYFDGAFRTSTTAPALVPQVVSWVFNSSGSTGKIRLNGVEIFSAAYTNSDVGGNTAVLSSQSGTTNNFLGEVETFMIYETAHDGTTLTAIEDNLMTFAGITP